MASSCDMCAHYVYDDEDDFYECLVNMDEDDFARFVASGRGSLQPVLNEPVWHDFSGHPTLHPLPSDSPPLKLPRQFILRL